MLHLQRRPRLEEAKGSYTALNQVLPAGHEDGLCQHRKGQSCFLVNLKFLTRPPFSTNPMTLLVASRSKRMVPMEARKALGWAGSNFSGLCLSRLRTNASLSTAIR